MNNVLGMNKVVTKCLKEEPGNTASEVCLPKKLGEESSREPQEGAGLAATGKCAWMLLFEGDGGVQCPEMWFPAGVALCQTESGFDFIWY